MSFKEEFKQIISELEQLQLNDDFRHEELWEKEVKIVTKDINETIDYLKTECTSDEFVWLSEVFRDIVEVCPSKEFVEELYRLSEKYPEDTKTYNVIDFIEEAEEYID